MRAFHFLAVAEHPPYGPKPYPHKLDRRCRYIDDNDTVTLYEILSYESAGLWVDSAGSACLPIMAVFEDDEREMRLLYSDKFCKDAKSVTEETEWICRRGKNPGFPTDRKRKASS